MNFRIDRSDVLNVKIVACVDINENEIIGDWVVKSQPSGECRYLSQDGMLDIWYETGDLGRYCNHHDAPNVIVKQIDDRLVLFSNSKIVKDQEIVVNYNDIIRFTGYIPNTAF